MLRSSSDRAGALERANGKDVLLVERFDRVAPVNGAVRANRTARRMMVSALTMLGLDEMEARYASYEELADIVRARFTRPRETLKEIFGRMVFNVLVGVIPITTRAITQPSGMGSGFP